MGIHRTAMGKYSSGRYVVGSAQRAYRKPEGNPMKVCIVSHSTADAGAERVLIEVVEVLRENGIQCLVVFPWEGPLIEAVVERGAEYKVLNYEWWVGDTGVRDRVRKVRHHIKASLKLALFLARNPCDLVITNTLTIPVGGLAATLLHVPHVWWIHEFGEEDHGLKFDLGIKCSTWFMDHASTMVLVNSAAVGSKYSKYIDRRKLHLIYYSVHLNLSDVATHALSAVTPGKPRICIVGRVTEGKGQVDAIRAMGKLTRDGTDATLLLVGPAGDYASHLSELARQLGVEDRVKFTGPVDNPLPIMSSCDVSAVCSRSEAFGRVTVEAMKLGRPVVGTRAGGTPELIEDGFNGFLYTPGNHDELASKLEVLLRNPELRNSMGAAGRSWALQRFTREKFRKDLVRLLSLALSGSKRRPLKETPGETVQYPQAYAKHPERHAN